MGLFHGYRCDWCRSKHEDASSAILRFTFLRAFYFCSVECADTWLLEGMPDKDMEDTFKPVSEEVGDG